MESISGELPELIEDLVALSRRQSPAVAIALIEALFENIERDLLEPVVDRRPKLTGNPDPPLTVGEQELSPPELTP